MISKKSILVVLTLAVFLALSIPVSAHTGHSDHSTAPTANDTSEGSDTPQSEGDRAEGIEAVGGQYPDWFIYVAAGFLVVTAVVGVLALRKYREKTEK
ncbi:MAG: hypothetical protein SVV03_01135 [Candidatus Nanohaloarchaea archaeon]|nr:hypothetical protein [Candidatus Nanohaloarchaea archaeon]